MSLSPLKLNLQVMGARRVPYKLELLKSSLEMGVSMLVNSTEVKNGMKGQV